MTPSRQHAHPAPPRTLRLGAIALLAFAATASLPPAAADDPPLAPYAWLIGVWVGQGETPGTGKYTDEYEYEWTMDRRFMKTTYVARAEEKIVWTDLGMVGWDAARGCMVGFNFGMDGTIGWGRSIEDSSAESFLMEGRVVGPDSTQWSEGFRVRMKRNGPDGLDVTMESKQGDAWVPQATKTYVRKGSGKREPTAEPDAPTPPEVLRALEPLVGTWLWAVKDMDTAGTPRPVLRIETAFEWRLNRTFLRRTEVVTIADGQRQETVEWIGWHPVEKAIAVFRFGSDGSVRAGAATFSEGTLAIERKSDWMDGKSAGKTEFRMVGGDRLTMRLEGPEGETLGFQATLERKK